MLGVIIVCRMPLVYTFTILCILRIIFYSGKIEMVISPEGGVLLAAVVWHHILPLDDPIYDAVLWDVWFGII